MHQTIYVVSQLFEFQNTEWQNVRYFNLETDKDLVFLLIDGP